MSVFGRGGHGGGGHGGGGRGGGGHRGGRGFRGGPGGGWWGPGWDWDYDYSLSCLPGAEKPGWVCDPSGNWHRTGFGAIDLIGAPSLPSMPTWLQNVLPFSDDAVKSPTLAPNKRWLLPTLVGVAVGAAVCHFTR